MTDDDLLRPVAVNRLLAELQEDIELVVMNAEIRNVDFPKPLIVALFNSGAHMRLG